MACATSDRLTRAQERRPGPSNLTIYFGLPRAAGAGVDRRPSAIYDVMGGYEVRPNGFTGAIAGTLDGLPDDGTFTGVLTATLSDGCIARRGYSGRLTREALNWNPGTDIENCGNRSPLTVSITPPASLLPPSTTIQSTSSSTSTTTPPNVTTTTTTVHLHDEHDGDEHDNPADSPLDDDYSDAAHVRRHEFDDDTPPTISTTSVASSSTPSSTTIAVQYALDVTLVQHQLSGPYAAFLSGPNGYTCSLSQTQDSVSCGRASFPGGTTVSLVLTITSPPFATEQPIFASTGCDTVTGGNTCRVLMNSDRVVAITVGTF